MKKVTLNQMIENTNISAKLIRAVVKQSGGWESFTESAPDIINHGIDGGFHGWIYYAETISFWKKNRAAILEMAADQAEEISMGGMLEMIQNFGVLRRGSIPVDELVRALYQGKGDDAQTVQTVQTVQNVMAWYAAEEVARLYVDLCEQEIS